MKHKNQPKIKVCTFGILKIQLHSLISLGSTCIPRNLHPHKRCSTPHPLQVPLSDTHRPLRTSKALSHTSNCAPEEMRSLKSYTEARKVDSRPSEKAPREMLYSVGYFYKPAHLTLTLERNSRSQRQDCIYLTWSVNWLISHLCYKLQISETRLHILDMD